MRHGIGKYKVLKAAVPIRGRAVPIQYKVLKAAVPIRGRAVPILFAAYPKWKLKKSQNQFEEAFFDLLSKLVPARTWTVIVADRGFARAELVSFLRELKMNDVIRVSSGATFRSEKFSGRLSGHGVKEGGMPSSAALRRGEPCPAVEGREVEPVSQCRTGGHEDVSHV
ncbi:MAG: transposase [Planctomycetota bacterium]|jgi:hypothetical protein